MPAVDEHEHEGEEGAGGLGTCQFCGGFGPAGESELDREFAGAHMRGAARRRARSG
jgi:hypothetical protein